MCLMSDFSHSLLIRHDAEDSYCKWEIIAVNFSRVVGPKKDGFHWVREIKLFNRAAQSCNLPLFLKSDKATFLYSHVAKNRIHRQQPVASGICGWSDALAVLQRQVVCRTAGVDRCMPGLAVEIARLGRRLRGGASRAVRSQAEPGNEGARGNHDSQCKQQQKIITKVTILFYICVIMFLWCHSSLSLPFT